jgi:DNA polymerase-3 subunit gamma/tau
VKVAKGVLPLVVRASGGSVRDALSVLGQLLAGAGKDGVTYEIAIQLLGFTDGALLDDAVDAVAARDAATLFKTVDRLIESGHDPRRFAQDFLERLRDLLIVGALDGHASNILRDYPEDQLERMRGQADRIGNATLTRAAGILAEGLLQMRGATAPRLILELICGRISLPGIDTEGEGLLARIERLERQGNLAPVTSAAASVKNEEAKEVKSEVKEDIKKEVQKAKIEEVKKVTPVGTADIAALRRLWPDVIENVKKRRRLTWSLLSASAQILSVDDKTITIAIVNAGARDSFIRSESEPILAGAFIDVVGIERKIELVVDPSISPNSPSSKTTRVHEDPSDENQLSGTDLLMKELGARVIAESE